MLRSLVRLGMTIMFVLLWVVCTMRDKYEDSVESVRRNEKPAGFQISPAGPAGVAQEDGRTRVVIARTFQLCRNQ